MPLGCRDAHWGEYQEEPVVIASAPGTLHLLGEHIEYAKGHVLSMALPRRAWVSVSGRSDHLVRVFSTNYRERKKFSLSGLKYKKEDRWANLCKGIMASFDNLGCRLGGINISIMSEIPEARGLGSSSAVGVALVKALSVYFDFSLTDAQVVWMVHTVETQYCGNYSHVASCFASVHSHAGALFVLDIRSQEYRHLRLAQGEFSFWRVDSMVNPHGSKAELASRREIFDALRMRVKPLSHGRELRDYSSSDAKELLEDLPEDQRRVGIYAIDEWSRSHLAEDTVEASNIPPLGKILQRSHEGLRDQLELSCPELDWLVKHGASVPGLLGGRMSGSALGASVIFLAKGDVDFTTMLNDYERIFGFKAQLERAVPSHKAQIHNASDYQDGEMVP